MSYKGENKVLDLAQPLPIPRYLFRPVLRALEAFALDLWQHEITQWLPASIDPAQVRKQTRYGGLYQKLVITL